MSVSTVIKAFLQTDIVSRTASAVRAANPGKYPSDDKVPLHLYQCLMDILGNDAQFLIDHVVEKYGEGLTSAESGIELSYAEADSVYTSEGQQSDKLGAKTAYVKVMCRIHGPVDPTTQGGLVEALSRRVEYILDVNNRSAYKGGGTVSNALLNPDGVDPSIDVKDGVRVHYIKDLNDTSAIERTTLWRAEYTVSFGK